MTSSVKRRFTHGEDFLPSSPMLRSAIRHLAFLAPLSIMACAITACAFAGSSMGGEGSTTLKWTSRPGAEDAGTYSLQPARTTYLPFASLGSYPRNLKQKLDAGPGEETKLALEANQSEVYIENKTSLRTDEGRYQQVEDAQTKGQIEGVADHRHAESIAEMLNDDGDKLPFYMVIIMGVVKPFLMIPIFGLSLKSKSTSSLLTRLTIAGTFTSLILTLIEDIQSLRAWDQRDGAWFDRVCWTVATLGVSSNVANSTALAQIMVLLRENEMWVKSVQPDNEHASQSQPWWSSCFEKITTGMLKVGRLYVLFVIGSILLFCSAAAIAYIWISIPLFLVFGPLADSCMPALALHLHKVNRYFKNCCCPTNNTQSGGYERTNQSLEVPSESELQEAKEAAKRKLTDAFREDLAETYETQNEYYNLTGATRSAWGLFFSTPILMSVTVPIFSLLAAQFYSGQGYLESVERTYNQRTFAQLEKYLFETASKSGSSVIQHLHHVNASVNAGIPVNPSSMLSVSEHHIRELRKELLEHPHLMHWSNMLTRLLR